MMNNKKDTIKIATEGIVEKSSYPEIVGMKIYIEPQDNTISNCESYQIFYSSTEGNEGYDDWVLNSEELEALFFNKDLKVKWL